MYLSNRDLKWALDCGKLIVDPKPNKIGKTSIDLRLDSVDQAKVWDIEKYNNSRRVMGTKDNQLNLGTFKYVDFGIEYLKEVPTDDSLVVHRYGDEILIKPHGFVLWQTKEEVGTSTDNAELICFIDGKSTLSRTGLLVHLTAPTIHASWSGRVTLEIANLGPFIFNLKEDDILAQITVAQVSSIPEPTPQIVNTIPIGQSSPTGT